MTFITKQKVYAYITSGNRLLVFTHIDFPEAGIQVPGGTVEPDEPLDQAVLREAFEETGLSDLILVEYLGSDTHTWTGLGQVHQRHFYHLLPGKETPERWRHDELFPSDGSPAPIRLEYYWASLESSLPELSGFQDSILPLLRQRLHIMP